LHLIIICGLQSIIDKCKICGTEGETIEHIISSCTVLVQSEYKKRHDIFAKIIHMNLAVKFNLLKNTQPHYSYTPESCLENDNYKLYFDRTVLTDIHIKHNRPDIIILNKQQKQAYLLDIAVPNSHNITQTCNSKINKYLELSVAMRNLSILPLVISATGIVPQSLFKNLKILDLGNTLVVEIQKGILLYSCHIVRKFLNIDTEHNKTQQSQNVHYYLIVISVIVYVLRQNCRAAGWWRVQFLIDSKKLVFTHSYPCVWWVIFLHTFFLHCCKIETIETIHNSV
jgi:hypothetical protein